MLKPRWRRLVSGGDNLLMLFMWLQLDVSMHAAGQYQRVKSFGFPDFMGQSPAAPLIQGSDGAFYGTARTDGNWNLGTIFRFNPSDNSYLALHHFSAEGGDAQYPDAALVEATDGLLYGTSSAGGSNGAGAIYKIRPDGSGYSVLYSFGVNEANGLHPAGPLVQGSDGALFGTTTNGGNWGVGTVFRLSRDGSDFRVLYHFSLIGGDGRNPGAGLLAGSDGLLYGTTQNGGSKNCGTIFRLGLDGSAYEIVHELLTSPDEGATPRSVLLEGSDGALYGTTYWGGSAQRGTVFKLNKDGSGFAVLTALGENPVGPLVESADGVLFGTTFGAIFKVNRDGTGFSVVHGLGSSFQDAQAAAGLLLGSDGALYGTSLAGGTHFGGTIFRLNMDGSAYGVLFNFIPAGGDGIDSYDGVREGTDGRLYGTAYSGGSKNWGVVFSLNRDGGDYRLLHEFDNSGMDGAGPHSPLLQGSDGALYGTTQNGGDQGGGTVFKMNPNGSGYQQLHSFHGDGFSPLGTLIQGSDGALYGTTAAGTTNYGGVFRVNRDGSGYGILHVFGVVPGDGRSPPDGVLEASDGMLYGTTWAGGSNDIGTVFKMRKDGTHYEILHHFAPPEDSYGSIVAGLVEGTDGALYSATFAGGTNMFGSVFRITRDGGSYRLVHQFSGEANEPHGPSAGLVRGWDGALYGVTVQGGSAGGGTVFRMDEDGSDFTVLYNFTPAQSDGWNVPGSLVEGADGAFYGAAIRGGNSGLGMIFRLRPTAVPRILGILVGENSTQVTFNGAVGQPYSVMRSSDLSQWLDLGRIQMPAMGIYTNIDLNPPATRAFYRVAWTP